MAQAGFTPISLYFSTTAAAVPTSGNLVAGELALNTLDEKLYFKNSAGTVKLLASNATSAPVLSFQTSLGGLTPSTATTGVVTLAGTLNTTSGGTGLTSFTAGDVPYYASGSVLSKLAIGTAGQFLTSTGTAPQWSTLSGVAVTTFSAGTTGFTPSSATSGAVTLAGTLIVANGGTGQTTFTANRVLYGNGTAGLNSSANLTFDGTSLTTASAVLNYTGTAVPFGGNNQALYSSTYAIGLGGQFGSLNFATTYAAPTTTAWWMLGRPSGADDAFTIDCRLGGAAVLVSAYKITSSGTDPAKIVDNHQWYTNGSERMRITSAGNVGIGTSSPTTPLMVLKSFSSDNLVYFGNTNTTASTSFGLKIAAGTNGSDYALGIDNAAATVSLLRVMGSGNMGLGVTPVASWSSGGQLQLADNKAIVSSGAYINLGANWYYDGGYRYISSTAATNYEQTLGAHKWSTAVAGTAANIFTFTTQMQLEAGGNLYLGTSGGSGKSIAINSDLSTTGAFLYNDTGQTILSAAANVPMIFRTNNTEKMRITAAGNVGIGTTSPAEKLSVAGAIRVHTASSAGFTSDEKGGLFDFVPSSNTVRVGYVPGTSGVNTGILTFLVGSGSTVGTFSSSGTLGVGNFSPYNTWGNSYVALQVQSIARTLAATGAGSGDLTLAFNSVYDSTDSRWEYASTGDKACRYSQTGGTDAHIWYVTSTNGTAGNAIAFTQAFTIQNDGTFFLNTTTATGNATGSSVNPGVVIGTGTITSQSNGNSNHYWSKATGYTSGDFSAHYVNGSYVGGISTNGSSTTYATSSDYRLKENVQPMTGALAKVAQLKPVTYTWKASGQSTQGFIAHELQSVVPDCVVGEKDAVNADGSIKPQGVDTSFLVATLTAAIQEQQAIIESLKARLDAANL